MRKTTMRTFVSTEIGRVRASGLPSDSMITLYRGRDMHVRGGGEGGGGALD